MKIATGLTLMTMFGLLAAAPRAQPPSGRAPARLFDGKSLEGWDGDRTIFRVQDGAIVGGTMTNKIARNEFLCTTRSYSDFELRLQFKLLGGEAANAGVQFRTKRIPDNNEVIGYQADMGKGYWGSLYDESRRKKTLQAPPEATLNGLVKIDDWNDYVIRADGTHIQLLLNGVKTVDYTETDASVAGDGLICVQIHAGPPSEAWYRNLEIIESPRR